MKRFVFVALLISLPLCLSAQEVTRKYDRFRGYSTASIRTDDIGLPGMKLMAYFIYPGETQASTAPSVHFMLTHSASSWVYLYSHDVTLLVDGKPIHPADVHHDGRVGSGYVLEFVTFELSKPQMDSLTVAKVAEIKVGSTEGTLNTATTGALRALYLAMVPSP